MVNFVLSFCKITGASKIFSRNFYLPLLKPLTPREAFRTFRITGKWLLGSKIQRYMPVLLNHKKKRSKNLKNYGKLKHKEKKNYTYMIPILDHENDSQKLLLNVLNKKEDNTVFVYTIEDRKLNIVLQAQLEYAVREGEIIDVLVSQRADKILVKLKDFKKIPLELEYCNVSENMVHGEGATSEEDEKLHHFGKYTMSLAKIFEDKEKQEEEWEILLKKIAKRRKRHAVEKTKEYRALVKENLRKLDWDMFEEEAKKFVDEIKEPREQTQEKPIDMEVEDLEKTRFISEYFSQKEYIHNLPTMDEISDVLKNMSHAHMIEKTIEINNEDGTVSSRIISGVLVTLSSGREVFVSGQIVHTEDGEVFVPGQTVSTDHGLEFVPGFTINIDGKPTLINGLIMAQNDNDPMFLPTQSVITADGQLTFALTEEERPPPVTEEHIEMRKERRLNFEKQKLEPLQEPTDVTEESETPSETAEIIEDEPFSDIFDEENLISILNEKDLIESEISDTDSGISEVDFEAIRLKQEQDRAELNELKKLLLEDGMEKLVTDLEDKKLSIQQRLDELRKLKMVSQRPLISYVTEKDALEIASKITEDNEVKNRIVDILLTMIRKTAAIKDKNNIHNENILETHVILHDDTVTSEKYHKSSKNLQILLKSSCVAANKVFKERPKDQVLGLEKIGEIFLDILSNNSLLLEEFQNLSQTSVERNEICDIIIKYLSYDYRDSKVNILSQIINYPKNNTEKILESVEKLLQGHNDVMCDAFLKLCKIDENILGDMHEHCKRNYRRVKIENDVTDVLEQSIKNATQSFMDTNFTKITDLSQEELKEFLEEANCFADALGLSDIKNSLSEINTNINQVEPKGEAFLKRVFLIQNLASKEFTLRKAIERLKRNPEHAKYDPRVRQLIRESGVLLSNGFSISNSKAIPLHLLKSQNLLGLEDFLIQRMKIDGPVLIIRNDYQAVIPKEALQAVESGRMPYILIDESGMSNFKPLHTLAAMKGGKNVDQFSNNSYSKFNCDIDFNKEHRNSALNRTSTNFA